MVRRSSDGDGYISSGDVDMNRLSSLRSSTSRLLLEQDRALAALPPRRASFGATTATTTVTPPPRRASFDDAIIATHKRRRSQDLPPAIQYQGQANAIVVHDGGKMHDTFEPEAQNIEEKRSLGARESIPDGIPTEFRVWR